MQPRGILPDSVTEDAVILVKAYSELRLTDEMQKASTTASTTSTVRTCSRR
jgi:hypothetical protein